MMKYDFQKIHVKIITAFAICTLIAFFFVGQQAFFNFSFDKGFDFWEDSSFYLLYCYTWGILLFIIIPIANKYRLEKINWLKYLPIHFSVGIFAALLHRIISLLAFHIIFYPENINSDFPQKVMFKVIGGSFDSFVTYWLILGVYYGFDYYRQYREHRVKTSELETKLAKAQLQALKMQLHPHFLFNTLHAISTLMEENIKSAQRMITKLSDLLRQTLDNIGIQEVSFYQELEFLRSYLEIEQTRFQDRLKIVYHIDPATLNASVPNLILQPLVENAIKHGIAPRAEGGEIEISSRKEEDKIILTVGDDGEGSSENGSEVFKNGLGLKNTIERLQQLHGASFSYEIKNGINKGFKVILTLPFIEYVESGEVEKTGDN